MVFSWLSTSWLSRFAWGKEHSAKDSTPESSVEKCPVVPFENIATTETNILVVGAQRERVGISRFIEYMATISQGNGVHYVNSFSVTETKQFKKMFYDEQLLEDSLLSRKKELDAYDSTPAFMVFDRNTVHLTSAVYKDILRNNKNLCTSTITVVTDASSLPRDCLKLMDMVVFFKDRNKARKFSTRQSVYNELFKKHIKLEVWNKTLEKSPGPLKAILASRDGLYLLKFNKRNMFQYESI